jgi:hypothetical protein
MTAGKDARQKVTRQNLPMREHSHWNFFNIMIRGRKGEKKHVGSMGGEFARSIVEGGLCMAWGVFRESQHAIKKRSIFFSISQ